jgi:hypothetical protein
MHPAAYTAFSKISFSTQDIGQMAALVGIDKLSHEDAAKNWLAGWLAGWLRRRIEAFHSNSKAVKDLNLSPGFNGRGGDFF